MKFALRLLVGGALLLSACGGNSIASDAADPPDSQVDCAGKPGLRASGSTAQQNAIEQFIYAYVRACPGRTLGYDANGSTAGVEDFASGQTDLAGSDLALDPSKGQPERAAARCGSPAWHLPTVFSPIAITYNISGVSSLNLDGPTAAKIFSGSITTWDNPAIKALNTGVTLPSTAIRVVFHSDKSGTTANFQKYLDDASDGAWAGGTTDTYTGSGSDGAVGNDGAAAVVQGTDGAVSYSEWSFALGKQLRMARISTPAGPTPVAISTESVAKTITGARFAGQGNDLVLDPSSLDKPTEAGAYPIVLPTYEIVCSRYPDAATGAAVKAFLQSAIGPGQDGLDQYGAIPLPESFRSKLLTAVNAVS
ncbi:MAG TPA: phosphate ABC transporter substrate-binding protein PstS [Mycobacterium sp.]|nr:phosphate ABC transporter substrate-binding protein PstS [Mycobacterium sp.]